MEQSYIQIAFEHNLGVLDTKIYSWITKEELEPL